MGNKFCLVGGSVFTKFADIVELLPCTAELLGLYIYFHVAIYLQYFCTLLAGEILTFPILLEHVFNHFIDEEVTKMTNFVLLSVSQVGQARASL